MSRENSGRRVRLSRRLAAWVVAPALVAGAIAGCSRLTGGPTPFEDLTGHNRMWIDDKAPSIAIGGLTKIRATAPFTILGVEPLHVTGTARVIATRAFFFGYGTTPGGYLYAPGLPSPVCARPPLTGWGTTYPVENLKLAPGDQPHFVFYLYDDKPGSSSISGYRIVYRIGHGRTRTHTGKNGQLFLTIHPPAAKRRCPGAETRMVAEPAPGWPSDLPTPLPSWAATPGTPPLGCADPSPWPKPKSCLTPQPS